MIMYGTGGEEGASSASRAGEKKGEESRIAEQRKGRYDRKL